ncbi:MAG: SMP-30/gluconolactonase/LRE family protein [Maricaulaceae bacterium]|jgi:arylesterase/paraoxonase
MKRLIGAVVVIALLAGVGYLAQVYLRASGAFASVEPRLAEQCASIDVHPGTEDVTFDPETGWAFVSASVRRVEQAAASAEDGIWAVDPSGRAAPRRVSLDVPADFHPHGISLWTGENGAQRLFAVSHRRDGAHVIEVFDVGENLALRHAETVTFDALISPNDILGVGLDSFYVTNDHGNVGGLMGALETWLALPLASVAYFDGEAGTIVAGGLAYANGIEMSDDGGTVYVAEVLGRAVTAYDRDAETGALARARRYPIASGLDNIEIAEDGALFVAGHPDVFAFLAHGGDETVISPSQVLRLDPETGDVETVFAALEGEINAASVGAVHDGRLLVGAVFDAHVLSCPMGE